MSYFSNLRVLITGAGSGIGEKMALSLAAQGAEIIVTARRKEAAAQVATKIIQAGGSAHPMVLDVSKLGTIEGFRKRLHEKVGAIDILINNAGVVFGGEFEKVSIKDHLNTYQINTLGVVAVTHAFMDDLISSRKGHLVNIASASAYVGLPFGSTYASSKWAVLGFSESLRLELRERGIRNVHVTTVCPSYISTGMFDGVKSPLLSPMLTPEKVVNAIIKGIREKQPLVQQPAMVKRIDFLKGSLPLPIWDEVAKIAGISTSMKHWRGKTD